MVELKIVGFHATSQENVQSIMNDGFNINKKRTNEWLGHGIYVFKHQIDAITWGKETYYCQPNPQIIKCYAEVQEDKYLNLDDPQKLDEYIEYYKKTLEKLSENDKKITFNNDKEAVCWGLNLYKKSYAIDIVEYTFRNNRTKSIMKYKSDKFSYAYNETQICITKNNVIYKKELCSKEE